jgi:hypothetical protein
MAVVQQLLWSPRYPKSVVIPDAVHLLKLKLSLANRSSLHHTFIHTTFAFKITFFFFFLLLPRLYSFVSNNV